MAFKLNRGESLEREELLKQLSESTSNVEAAIETYNAKIVQAFAALKDDLDKHNAVIAEVREFVQHHASDWQDEYSGKSERWQESDKGMAAAGLIEAWEGFETELDDTDIEEPEPIELDFHTYEQFRDLPTEPDREDD